MLLFNIIKGGIIVWSKGRVLMEELARENMSAKGGVFMRTIAKDWLQENILKRCMYIDDETIADDAPNTEERFDINDVYIRQDKLNSEYDYLMALKSITDSATFYRSENTYIYRVNAENNIKEYEQGNFEVDAEGNVIDEDGERLRINELYKDDIIIIVNIQYYERYDGSLPRETITLTILSKEGVIIE